MYPIWDMVEPASTFLMSSLAQPMIAPNISVIAPMAITTVCAVGAPSKMGVGPGDQVDTGGHHRGGVDQPTPGSDPPWRPATTTAAGTARLSTRGEQQQQADPGQRPLAGPPACAEDLREGDRPNVTRSIAMIATDSPKSPTRLTTKAFFAATAALGLYCQNPISRYDAKPTPSQPT